MNFPRYFKENEKVPLLLRFDSETAGKWLRTGTDSIIPLHEVTHGYLRGTFSEIDAEQASKILGKDATV